jgi:hypothetical protein
VKFRPIPDDRESIAPKAVTRRLYYRQRDGRGQGSVYGIPPLKKHPDAGLRGKWLRRGHHVSRENGRTM